MEKHLASTVNTKQFADLIQDKINIAILTKNQKMIL